MGHGGVPGGVDSRGGDEQTECTGPLGRTVPLGRTGPEGSSEGNAGGSAADAASTASTGPAGPGPQARPVSLAKGDGPLPASGEGAARGPSGEEPFEGCLTRIVRLPVRIVTLLLVVPVRLVWDALAVCGRALRRTLWVPFARAAAWVWCRVLAPVLFALFVWPWAAAWRYVLAPAGRGLAWLARKTGSGVSWLARGLWAGIAWLGRTLVAAPLVWLYRCVLTPVGRAVAAAARAAARALAWLGGNLVAAPLVWLYRHVLTPAGRVLVAALVGVGLALAWLWRYLVVVPLVWAYRYVLRPVGLGAAAVAAGVGAGLAWLWRYAVAEPWRFLRRRVFRPVGWGLAVVGREIADAVVHAWRVAGHVSRAVFRFFGRVLRFLFVAPVVWLWRHVVRPVGRGLRYGVGRPVAAAAREAGRSVHAALSAARASVRETRAELRRALFGGPAPAARAQERRSLSGSGRVPWSAGSPHDSATAPEPSGAKRDAADFRTL